MENTINLRLLWFMCSCETMCCTLQAGFYLQSCQQAIYIHHRYVQNCACKWQITVLKTVCSQIPTAAQQYTTTDAVINHQVWSYFWGALICSLTKLRPTSHHNPCSPVCCCASCGDLAKRLSIRVTLWTRVASVSMDSPHSLEWGLKKIFIWWQFQDVSKCHLK